MEIKYLQIRGYFNKNSCEGVLHLSIEYLKPFAFYLKKAYNIKNAGEFHEVMG